MSETESIDETNTVVQADETFDAVAEEQHDVLNPEGKKKKKARVMTADGEVRKKKRRADVVEELAEEEDDDPKSKIAFLKAEANYEITKIKSELARKIMSLTKE